MRQLPFAPNMRQKATRQTVYPGSHRRSDDNPKHLGQHRLLFYGRHFVMLSTKRRLERMIATVTDYPLARIVAGPEKRKGLTTKKLDLLERTHGVMLGPALREFFGTTNGFTLFWRVPEDVFSDAIDRYNAAAPNPTTRINWEMTHGIMIPPLETVLTEKTFGDIFITSRDEETMVLWAGRWMSDGVAAASIRVFDRYLAQGNEDGCIGLLVFPMPNHASSALRIRAWWIPNGPG
jgi:hypothetical protein